MIESPNGPTSQGRCLLCGAEGEFKNSMPISGWDRDGSKAKKNNNSATGNTSNTNNAGKTDSNTSTDTKAGSKSG